MRPFIVVLAIGLAIALGYYAQKFTYTADGPLFQDVLETNTTFCNHEDCAALFYQTFKNSTKLDCAFFEVDEPLVVELMKRKYSRLVTDNRETLSLPNLRKDKSQAYMHNKFCIDEKNVVWTGSWNPTISARNDRNNIVILPSSSLAKVYRAEFDELWKGTFGGGKKGSILIRSNSTYVTVAFCPEDNCQSLTIKTILSAQSSIDFMTFSFTDHTIADAIIQQHQNGVQIRGLAEPLFVSQSVYSKLQKDKIAIRSDQLPGFLHNKVFIIDNKIVITGSYNPTKNGNENNDENMLVLENVAQAALFEREFEDIWMNHSAAIK